MTVDRNGRPTVDNTDVGTPLLNLGTGQSMDGSQNRKAGSLLSEALESHFASVLIVVDATKIGIDPSGTLTDYVAMLALSQTKTFAHCLGLPSVANLAAPSCSAGATTRLSLTDIAYLRGLYAVRLTEEASLQKGEIVKRINRVVPP